MPVRGLTAEQLYDSLAQAIGLRPTKPPSGCLRRREYAPRPSSSSCSPTTTRSRPKAPDVDPPGAGPDERPAHGRGDQPRERRRRSPAVAEAPFLDTAGRIETLFLATLSRPAHGPRSRPGWSPTSNAAAPTGDRRKALADVFWALLNSPEFRFNH